MTTTRIKKALLFIILFSAGLLSSQPDTLHHGSFTLGEIEIIGIGVHRSMVPVDRLLEPAVKTTGRQSVAHALMRLPGIHFNHVGERNEARVYVRGFDVKRVPIYLDGIPIYVPYNGYPDLGRFLVNDISAIVVSKGYSSVLYGPNTMGGAINLVSRKPQDRFEGNAGISYASGNARQLFFNAGIRREQWYIQTGGIYSASDYFRTSQRDAVVTGIRRDNAYENDNKVSFKVGFIPSNDGEYTIGYAIQRAEKGNPVYLGSHPSVRVQYRQWPTWNKESIYFNSSTRVLGSHQLKTRLYYDTFVNALYSYDDDTYSTMETGRAFRSYHDDYTYGGSVEMTLEPGLFGTIRTALHYKRDIHRDQHDDEPQLRFDDNIVSAAVEIQLPLSDNFFMIGGASIDRIQSFRAEYYDESANEIKRFPNNATIAFNPQLGAVFTINNTNKLHATIARKSRLPTMRDRYSFRLGRTIPNPTLAEERATHYEIGYSALLFKNLFVQSEMYLSTVDNFIMFATIPDPDNPGFNVEQNVNIGRLNKYGFDLQTILQIDHDFNIEVTYSYINIDNRTTADRVTDIPRHLLHAELSYNIFENAWIWTDIMSYSRRYSSSDGERIADGFVVTNLIAEIPLIRKIKVRGGINNVFDTPYEFIEGYPQPGRNIFINVKYKW